MRVCMIRPFPPQPVLLLDWSHAFSLVYGGSYEGCTALSSVREPLRSIYSLSYAEGSYSIRRSCAAVWESVR